MEGRGIRRARSCRSYPVAGGFPVSPICSSRSSSVGTTDLVQFHEPLPQPVDLVAIDCQARQHQYCPLTGSVGSLTVGTLHDILQHLGAGALTRPPSRIEQRCLVCGRHFCGRASNRTRMQVRSCGDRSVAITGGRIFESASFDFRLSIFTTASGNHANQFEAADQETRAAWTTRGNLAFGF